MDLIEKLWDLIVGTTKPSPVEAKRTEPLQPSFQPQPLDTEKTDGVVPPESSVSQKQPTQLSWTDLAPPIPPRSRSRSERSIVIVGFDFGTHSTKVLYRPRKDEVARVLALGKSAPGYPAFATPSLVRLEDGALWFGETALSRTGGTLYRSLKVRLLGPASEPDEEFPAGPSPDFLVAAFLAWAFSSVRRELERNFANADVRLNLAIPMDHMEDPGLKIRLLQIVQAAWDVAFDRSMITIEQGCMLEAISDELKTLLSREVIDEAERKFDVLPETVAPIVSLSMNPQMVPGMYMIVDVGAGTTEISVNHTNEQGVDNQVLCYFDQTITLGGDRFAELQNFPPNEHAERCELLVSELVKACTRVWATGYQKDAPNHVARKRWRSLEILLAGGGTRHPAVSAAFRKSSRLLDQLKLYQVNHQVASHAPANVDLGQFRASKSDLSLLAVAQGLTRERQTWPILFEPAKVEKLIPTSQVDRPDSYWYVEGK